MTGPPAPLRICSAQGDYEVAFRESVAEVVTDLLTVGLSYLLTPGDAVVDATETVDLPLLPKG